MSPTRIPIPIPEPSSAPHPFSLAPRALAAFALLVLSLPAQSAQLAPRLELVLGESGQPVRAHLEQQLSPGTGPVRWHPPVAVLRGSLSASFGGAQPERVTLTSGGSVLLERPAEQAADATLLSLRWRAAPREESGGFSLRLRAGGSGLHVLLKDARNASLEAAAVGDGGGADRVLHLLGASGASSARLPRSGKGATLKLPMGDTWLVWSGVSDAPRTGAGLEAVSLVRQASRYGGRWITLWDLHERAKPWALDLRVVLDTSASGSGRRLADQAAAISALLAELGSQDRVGVLVGSESWDWWLPLGSRPGAPAQAKWAARSTALSSRGATDLGRMFDALEEAEEQHVPAQARRPVLIWLGDGQATLGTVRPMALLSRLRSWQPQRGALGVLAAGEPAPWLRRAWSERGFGAVSGGEASGQDAADARSSSWGERLLALVAEARAEQLFARGTQVLGVRSETSLVAPDAGLAAQSLGLEFGRWRGLAPAEVSWRAQRSEGSWSGRAPVGSSADDGLHTWMEREASRLGRGPASFGERVRLALPGPSLAQAMAPLRSSATSAADERAPEAACEAWLDARLGVWRTLLGEARLEATTAASRVGADRVGLCFLAGRYWLLDNGGWLATELLPLAETSREGASQTFSTARWEAVRESESARETLMGDPQHSERDLPGALELLLWTAPRAAFLEPGSPAAEPRGLAIFGR